MLKYTPHFQVRYGYNFSFSSKIVLIGGIAAMILGCIPCAVYLKRKDLFYYQYKEEKENSTRLRGVTSSTEAADLNMPLSGTLSGPSEAQSSAALPTFCENNVMENRSPSETSVTIASEQVLAEQSRLYPSVLPSEASHSDEVLVVPEHVHETLDVDEDTILPSSPGPPGYEEAIRSGHFEIIDEFRV